MDDNYNYNDFQEFNQQPQTPKRPQMLTVLCVLTFFWTGLSIMVSLMVPPLSSLLVEILKTNPQFDATRDGDVITIFEAGWKYYGPVLCLNVLALSGAIMMWKLKKNGFHFYTIANILLFFLPILMLGLPFSLAAAFIPAMFVGMYALNLRYMY